MAKQENLSLMDCFPDTIIQGMTSTLLIQV